MNEKKYNEALEQAKKELAACGSMDCDAARLIFRLFPQLRESEDERIRKAVVSLVYEMKGTYQSFAKVELDQMVAWLEKQKEPKGLPLMDGNAELYFDEWNQQQQNPTKRQCFEEGIRYAKRLQKEQKPVEWEDIKDKVNVPYCSSEQEWSEDDRFKLEDAITAIDIAIAAYKEEGNHPTLLEAFKKAKSFLKSLRPSWKPSEEQIRTLYCVAYGMPGPDGKILMSLCNDLEKQK